MPSWSGGVVLPMNHSLDDDDIGYVIGLVNDFLATA